MATQFPPKKNAAFIDYVGLVEAADGRRLKANPTLAAGDAKVSIDGGAFANLTTLPTVTPASGKAVKISLSQSEMNGDNIIVVLSDQTDPPEWADLILSYATTARQIDDLAFPNTSGRGMDVDASGGVEVGSFQDSAITHSAFSAASGLRYARSNNIAANVAGTSVTLDASASAAADAYAGMAIHFPFVNPPVSRRIVAYDGATKVATMDRGLPVSALTGETYLIFPMAHGYGTQFSTDGQLVDAVWDELLADHVTANTIGREVGLIGTLATDIKAKTDNLPIDPADQSQIIDATNTLATLIGDVPTNAELATALAGADDAVLDAIAALTIPSASANAAALLATAFEGAETVQDFLRLSRAALYGKSTGMETTAPAFRDAADTKNRIEVVGADESGNRPVVNLDPN